jgi:hypothetical protein
MIGSLMYRVVLEEAEEGGYVVTRPALPGCISEGGICEKALGEGAPGPFLWYAQSPTGGSVSVLRAISVPSGGVRRLWI